ncbi:MAG: N-acetylneuraminate synthase [Promethearchaeota archaeon]
MWSQDFHIGSKRISQESSVFIVAEAGVNHNGDIDLAKQLIDIASEAEVDAVKFQTFVAEEVVTSDAGTARYQQKITGKEKQIDLIKGFELPLEAFRELYAYAHDKGLIFLSTPFDLISVDFLAKIQIPAFKIPSGEIVNPLMIKRIAKYKLPVILSTGMATLGDIERALLVLQRYSITEVLLLHCVTSYPTPIDQANIRMIPTLRKTFNILVGFSDHTLGTTAAIAAVSLGAKAIEKHFTLDRELPGPDHKASLEPEELKQLVSQIRETEAALGSGIKTLMANEAEIKRIARRSIVAARDLNAGEVLSEENLSLKRPEDGLPPQYLDLVIGKRLKSDIKMDQRLSFNDIEWD